MQNTYSGDNAENSWIRIRDASGYKKVRKATINSPAGRCLRYRTHQFAGQSGSKKGLLWLTEQLCTVDAKSLIFFAQRAMDGARCLSAADKKLD
jgi:hypothetical protein